MDVNWEDMFSLERQYIFYKADHQHPANIFAHVVCDPLLSIPMLALFSLLPLPFRQLPDGAALTALLFTVYNVRVGGKLGVYITPTTVLYYYLAVKLRDAVAVAATSSLAVVAVAAAANAFVWPVLFHCHRVFEGGRPSLTRSVAQAVAIEPLLIWLDVMFALGLFRDERKRLEKARVEAELQRDREDFHKVVRQGKKNRM